MNTSATIYKVSELSAEMRRLMESSYPQVWIEGELSSLSTPASGHLYFSLKDEQSQLRCAMFKGRASISRYRPKAGDLVRVRAKISVYTARGDLQCIVQHIEEAGEGLLQRRYEELKQALNQQGLFAASAKQAIPKFAKKIGLITSPSGAAVKDVVSTLARRCPGIPVLIYPAVVQGESAASSLIDALNDAIQHNQCDVLIITRGGGSMEDLWCFNDEQLAQRIFSCPIPIVSGVGHEVDVTIADLVADVRAPTPTAAAELVSPDTSHLLSQLQSLHFRMPRAIERQLQNMAQKVDLTARQLVHPKQQLRNKRRALEQSSASLLRKVHSEQQRRNEKITQMNARFKPPRKQLGQLSANHADLQQRLQRALSSSLRSKNQQFKSISTQLNTVSPLATIGRGFAIARDSNGQILRSHQQVKTSQNINIELAEGELECEVVASKA